MFDVPSACNSVLFVSVGAILGMCVLSILAQVIDRLFFAEQLKQNVMQTIWRRVRKEKPMSAEVKKACATCGQSLLYDALDSVQGIDWLQLSQLIAKYGAVVLQLLATLLPLFKGKDWVTILAVLQQILALLPKAP